MVLYVKFSDRPDEVTPEDGTVKVCPRVVGLREAEDAYIFDYFGVKHGVISRRRLYEVVSSQAVVNKIKEFLSEPHSMLTLVISRAHYNKGFKVLLDEAGIVRTTSSLLRSMGRAT
jgi:hypothetical protein